MKKPPLRLKAQLEAEKKAGKAPLVGISASAEMKPGFYWARFSWGWEPARYDGDDWLRFGVDASWNEDVREVGPELVKPEGYPSAPAEPRTEPQR
jgi:hypothetical protein